MLPEYHEADLRKEHGLEQRHEHISGLLARDLELGLYAAPREPELEARTIASR